ncbi:sigma-70 family RNA polymerase sigma factor [bacterium]|nr:sigma-70 family RNA polymerase sigma factor [bacterium]
MSKRPLNLIHRLKAGDLSGIEDVVAWYSADVHRMCFLLLKDEHEAKDIVQEAYYRLVVQVQKGKIRSENGSIKGFLMTAARNLCLDRLKKRNRFIDLDEESPYQPKELLDRHTPDRAAAEEQFQQDFEEALDSLPVQQRTILVLYDVGGESHRAIAEALQVSEGSVRTQLCRARRTLRRLLAFYGDAL